MDTNPRNWMGERPGERGWVGKRLSEPMRIDSERFGRVGEHRTPGVGGM